MNHAQIESLFDFIAGCIKRHGKRTFNDSLFKGNTVQYELSLKKGDSITLKESTDERILYSCCHVGNDVNVIIKENTFILDNSVVDQERNLIKLAILCNGDMNLDEYFTV